jgi:hypothetical protein
MRSTSLTRRTLLQGTALAAVGAPFVRGACAAGKLGIGFWDHWVPGANEVLATLCREWAEKEKVEIKIDFITSQGDKLMLTGAAEEQARSGHDILGMPTWYAAPKAERLVPVDDLMKTLIAANGAVSPGHEYLCKVQGHWIAVPATAGTLTLPPCSRLDLFKEHVGLDLTKMYPAAALPDKALADNWTPLGKHHSGSDEGTVRKRRCRSNAELRGRVDGVWQDNVRDRLERLARGRPGVRRRGVAHRVVMTASRSSGSAPRPAASMRSGGCSPLSLPTPAWSSF